MAGNLIQIKRTSVPGRAANTSTLTHAGELALNMADGILYSTNGSAVFEIGANNTNVQVTANLTVKTIIANNFVGNPGQVLTTNGTGVYWSTVTSGGGGADPNAQYYWSNTQTFANTITFLQTINGTANSANYIGTLPAANVVSNAQLQANLASIGSLSNSSYTATLRSDGQFQLPLSTQGGINAGWIVSTNNVGFNAAGNLWKFGADGTMSSPYSVVISTTGLNFPSSGSINSTSYTGTANNASYLGGNTASDLRTYSDNKAANAYSNAVTYASNASNLTTGTLPYARLGTNVVNTTASFAFSNTITFNGNTAFYGSVTDSFGSDGLAGQILTSSGSGNTYWSSKYYVGSLPPAYPNYGDTWYYTDLEKLFMWINDGGSDYWYDFLPPVA